MTIDFHSTNKKDKVTDISCKKGLLDHSNDSKQHLKIGSSVFLDERKICNETLQYLIKNQHAVNVPPVRIDEIGSLYASIVFH